jgi:hypothetical protein
MSPFHTICVEAYLILPEGVGLFCKYILNILLVNQLSLYWANHKKFYSLDSITVDSVPVWILWKGSLTSYGQQFDQYQQNQQHTYIKGFLIVSCCEKCNFEQFFEGM